MQLAGRTPLVDPTPDRTVRTIFTCSMWGRRGRRSYDLPGFRWDVRLG